jgi:hypothetical protein
MGFARLRLGPADIPTPVILRKVFEKSSLGLDLWSSCGCDLEISCCNLTVCGAAVCQEARLYFPASRFAASPFSITGALRLNQNGHEVVEVGGVDVADRDDTEVGRGGGAEGEACAGAGQSREAGAG